MKFTNVLTAFGIVTIAVTGVGPAVVAAEPAASTVAQSQDGTQASAIAATGAIRPTLGLGQTGKVGYRWEFAGQQSHGPAVLRVQAPTGTKFVSGAVIVDSGHEGGKNTFSGTLSGDKRTINLSVAGWHTKSFTDVTMTIEVVDRSNVRDVFGGYVEFVSVGAGPLKVGKTTTGYIYNGPPLSPKATTVSSATGKPGGTVAVIADFDGTSEGKLKVTAPASTKITGINYEGAVISADGKTAEIGPESTWWSADRKITLQIDADAAEGVKTGGLVETIRGGDVYTSGAFSVTVEIPFSVAVESTDVSGRTAVVAGVGEPGASVILNDTAEVAVAADGRWSWFLEGLKLGSNPLHAEQWEQVNGVPTKTGEADVDVKLAFVGLSVAAAFDADVAKDVVLSGVAERGALVEVKNPAGVVVASVAAHATTGRWSVPVVAPGVAGVSKLSVSQTITGELAETVAVSVDYGTGVAITSPQDGAAHSGGALQFRGTGVPMSTIDFFDGDKKIDSVRVLSNGSWNKSISLAGSQHVITVKQLSKGNNVTSSTVTLNPGANVVDVALIAPAKDAKLKDARPVFSGTGENGATIEVVEAGKTIATATVAGGKWSATPTADMSVGVHSGVVNQKVAGVQQSSVPFSFTREVVEEYTLKVTSPVVGDSFAAESNGEVTPVFTGTATPGATVRVQGPWGDVFATTIADAEGAWSARWMFGVRPNHFIGGATVELVNGVETSRVGYDFTVTDFVGMDTLKVTSPVVGDSFAVERHGEMTPVFTGTATPGAIVQVEGPWGHVFASATADSAGAWSARWTFGVLPNHYVGGSTVEYVNGVEVDREGYDFMVTARASLVVDSPAFDGVLKTNANGWLVPTFVGTATPGADVRVQNQWGLVVGSTVADVNGDWSIDWSFAVTPERYYGSTVESIDGADVNSALFEFSVVKG